MKFNRHRDRCESRAADMAVCGFGRRPDRWMPRRTAGRDACATSAFTLVEVAIALAVIGFALVAIIGILPAGLNVQKENREETIINQEVSLWMDAIRQGSEGMDYLTNYVDLIQIRIAKYDDNGVLVVTNIPGSPFEFTPDQADPDFQLTNGAMIVQLLSTPKYRAIPGGGGFLSNHVVSYVRAVSGSATEKVPQDNLTVREGSFSYRLTSEVTPFYAHDDRWYDFGSFLFETSGGGNDLSLAYAQDLAENLHDVRLRFEWPLRPPFNGLGVATNSGNGRLTFRSLVGGSIVNLTALADPPVRWRIQSGTYSKPGRRQ